MKQKDLKKLKLDISIEAKNGVDFIIAACIVWLIITFVWTLGYSSYDKSILTFIVGALLLPSAFLISKILKTNWTIKNNPLDPLGLWLNFAQLFYFPFLIFILIKNPDYFIMTYAIITGAHFFPYAWFFDEIGYAISAGIISVGALIIALSVETNGMYIVPLFTSATLLLLAIWIFVSHKKKLKTHIPKQI